MGTTGMEPSTTAGRAMGSQEVSEREAGSPTCLSGAGGGSWKLGLSSGQETCVQSALFMDCI